jgi:hypothetical protein
VSIRAPYLLCCLLLVLVVRQAASTKPSGSIPAETTLRLSREPCLGETVEVIFTITPSEDIPEMRVTFELIRGTEWGGGDTVFESSASKGETKEFRTRVRFVSSPATVGADAKGHAVASDGRRYPLKAGRSLGLITVDEETGRLSRVQQKLASGPEYRYDMMQGVIYPPGQYYGTGPGAREMIEKLKRLEPRLTDWEAVYLHRDALRAYERGIGRGDQQAEDERIDWLLEKGWLEKQREGEEVKEKWLEDLFEEKLLGQDESTPKETPYERGQAEVGSEIPIVRVYQPFLVWWRLAEEPRLNQEVDFVCMVTADTSVPQTKLLFSLERGLQHVSGDTIVHTSVVGGETLAFEVRVKFVSSPVRLNVDIGTWKLSRKKEEVFKRYSGVRMRLFLIDERTGRFGGVDGYRESRPEFRYELSGTIHPPGVYLGSGRHTRAMIERLKMLEPRLTDWEACYLHRDALRALWKGIGGGEEDRIYWLLSVGWLEKQREGEEVKEKWLEGLFERKLQEQEDSELKGECIDIYLVNAETAANTESLNVRTSETATEQDISTSVPVQTPRQVHNIRLSLVFLGIPKLGEEVTLVCLATPDIDIPRMRLDFKSSKGAEILSGPGSVHISAKKGETKAYKVRVRYRSVPADVTVLAHVRVKEDEGKEFWEESGWTHTGCLMVVDEETGRLGGWDEYRNSKLVFRYDGALGRWLESGDPGYEANNSKIIDRIRKLEPALTDSEALCLYADIVNPETPYKHQGPVEWNPGNADPEKYLLDRGWLEKHRQGDHVKVPWLRALSDSLGKEWEAVREEFEARERLELERRERADDILRQRQEDSEPEGECAQVAMRSEPAASTDKPGETDEVPIWRAILPARTTLELSQPSRIGDEVELICTVTPDVDVPKLRVAFAFQMGAEPVSEPTVFYVSAKKGEPKTCRVRAKLTSAPVKVTANVASCFKNYRGEEVARPSRGATLRLYLVDEETGRLATSPAGPRSEPITQNEVASQFRESLRPRLVWEREFDRYIFAAGVDKNRFDPGKQNIASCIKWVLLHGGEFRLVDTLGADTTVDITKIGFEKVSRNTRYFMVQRWNRTYGFYDWDGRRIWETGDRGPTPLHVLDDGSFVFMHAKRNGRFKDIEKLGFYGPGGRLGRSYVFPEDEIFYGSAAGERHIVIATRASGLWLFGKQGKLLWKRKWTWIGEEPWWFYGLGHPHSLTVSNRGEVLLIMTDGNLLVYDATGTLTDTVELESIGYVNAMKAVGRLAFGSFGRTALFCYDLDLKQAKFLVEKSDMEFRDLDLDERSKLVALIGSESDTVSVIRVYDFEGNYRGQVSFSVSPYRKPWFKLLSNAILLAEGTKLKLYALNSDD